MKREPRKDNEATAAWRVPWWRTCRSCNQVRGDLGENLMALTLGASIAFNSHRHLLDQGRKEFALGIKDLDPTIKAMCFAHADEE